MRTGISVVQKEANSTFSYLVLSLKILGVQNQNNNQFFDEEKNNENQSKSF